MIFGSVCSGIEAATVAWAPLGWKAAWYAEIEKFPAAVLAHRHPETPNLGDMTKMHESEVFNGSAIDVLVGGTPCQSFSIAGLRKGLDDPRGNLALVFLALLDRKRPRWVVWENVPGVLSSWSDEAGSFADEEGGRERGWQSNDFDTFTSGLRELGYGLSWRVLDAQYFGVPQRRQRVFVVGHLGDWRPAAAVLFESHGLSGYSAPRRQAGERASPTLSARTKSGGGLGTDHDINGGLIENGEVAKWFKDKDNDVAHTLRGEGFDASEDGTGRGTPLVAGTLGANHGNIRAEDAWGGKLIAFGSKDSGADAAEDLAPTLRAGTHDGSHANAGVPPAVCYDMRGNGEGDNVPTLTGHHAGAVSDFSPMVFQPGNLSRGAGASPSTEVAATLKSDHGRGASDQDPHVAIFQQNSRSEVREVGGDGQIAGAVTGEPGAQCQNYLKMAAAVRRLTPRECERLQGFPNDYTLIPYRGGVAADGPRYKACGNSMAVPVMRWIGERIVAVDALLPKNQKRMWPE